MTSTIALRWALHSHDSYLQYEKSIRSFKEKINPIVETLAPEYFDLLDSMHPMMVNVLIDTLQHWKNQQFIQCETSRRFIETKLIECLAFWKGYLDAGGEFPLKEINNNNTLDFYKPNKTYKENTAHDNIVAIIPIGNTNPNIEKILMTTLNTLNKNSNIGAIYCVFDGTKHREQLQLEKQFEKIQILEIPSKRGPANARNIGIDEGLIFGMSDALFLDSDITLTPEILDHLLHDYMNSKFGIFSPIVKAEGDQWLDIYHDLSGTLNGRYLFETNTEQLLFGTTCCMIVPKSVLEEGIKFSRDFSIAAGEDIDFCLQLYKYGYPIYPIDTIAVNHWYGNQEDQSVNWNRFKDRFYRYGMGESIVIRRNPNYYDLLSRTKERIIL